MVAELFKKIRFSYLRLPILSFSLVTPCSALLCSLAWGVFFLWEIKARAACPFALRSPNLHLSSHVLKATALMNQTREVRQVVFSKIHCFDDAAWVAATASCLREIICRRPLPLSCRALVKGVASFASFPPDIVLLTRSGRRLGVRKSISAFISISYLQLRQQ